MEHTMKLSKSKKTNRGIKNISKILFVTKEEKKIAVAPFTCVFQQISVHRAIYWVSSTLLYFFNKNLFFCHSNKVYCFSLLYFLYDLVIIFSSSSSFLSNIYGILHISLLFSVDRWRFFFIWYFAMTKVQNKLDPSIG